MATTYFVVVVFDYDEQGDLKQGDTWEVASAFAAERSAQKLVREHAGAVGFSRSGDPLTGEFDDAVVVTKLGAFDLDALIA